MRQVRAKETSVSEPLMRCRNHRDDVETGDHERRQEKPKGNLVTAWVTSGIEVARTWFRLLCGTWEPVVPMVREKPKWRTHQGESTDAEHGDGITRSSDEVS